MNQNEYEELLSISKHEPWCGLPEPEDVAAKMEEVAEEVRLITLRKCRELALKDCHCEPDFSGHHSCGATRIATAIGKLLDASPGGER